MAEIRASFERANTQYRAQHYDSAAVAYVEVSDLTNGANPDSSWQIARDANYNAACCFALLGNAGKAFAFLDSAAAHGFWDWNFISMDKDLKSLHHDPHFELFRQHIQAAKDSLTHTLLGNNYLVRTPRDTTGIKSDPIFLVLHGANSIPGNAINDWQAMADSLKCILVAPYGMHVRSSHELSFGLNADSADRYILRTIRDAEARLGRVHRRWFIGGIGQGGTMAMQIAMKHPELYDGVMSINSYYNASFCNKFIPDVRRYGLCLSAVYDAASTTVAQSILRAEEQLRSASINVQVQSIPHAESAPDQAAILHALKWMFYE